MREMFEFNDYQMAEIKSNKKLLDDAFLLYDEAIKLYNFNDALVDFNQVEAVVKSLKIVVSSYKALMTIQTKETSSGLKFYSSEAVQFLPKVLTLIAYCNYRLQNYNNAYYVAKQALLAVENAYDELVFEVDVNSLYRKDLIEELINVLEFKYINKINAVENIYSIPPEEINLCNYEKIIDSISNESNDNSCSLLADLVHYLSNYQNVVINESCFRSEEKENYIKTLELYKFPLYHAWNFYGYGEITDLLEYPNYIQPLFDFKDNAKKEINKLLITLKEDNPFYFITIDNSVVQILISVYSKLIKDLDNLVD